MIYIIKNFIYILKSILNASRISRILIIGGTIALFIVLILKAGA